MNSDKKKARIVKANRLLQAKIGTGEVDPEVIEKSQKVIDENKVDFAPMAEEYIAALQSCIEDAQKKKKSDQDILEHMIEPVMQIKANAKMFDYELIGNLANIMLNFLETIDEIDGDVLDIVEAHQKTLVIIVKNKMRGDGGEYGEEITSELKEACKRYFAKQASSGKIIEDKDAFFIDG